MLGNEAILGALAARKQVAEKGRSSYWDEHLDDFDFRDNKFIGKLLPEGGGRRDRTPLLSAVHRIFQFRFMRMGRKFSSFDLMLDLAVQIQKQRGALIDLGTIRQALTLSMIDENLDLTKIDGPFVVIGDGFGVMSSLLIGHFQNTQTKVVVVNLASNLFVDAFHIHQAFPQTRLCLPTSSEEYCQAVDDPSVTAILVQADDSPWISEKAIGLAINLNSMQEMDPPIIQHYFDLIRSSKSERSYFYCCNRFSKTLPDGTVVNFLDYPWHAKDVSLVDELCPWSQFYYSFRPPFYHRYDGPHQHRLVKMMKSEFHKAIH